MEDVLILAADAVSPFVTSGFGSLGLLTPESTRPFAKNRQGFHLGDAAAIIHITSDAGRFRLQTGLDSEGSVITRPSTSSLSLKAAIEKLTLSVPPDVIIAHATATPVNDQTEALAFVHAFGETQKNSPLITGIKWCVGHTLGASGALDLIVACETLRRQEITELKTTAFLDPDLRGQFAAGEYQRPSVIKRVMTSSLGFGGMHAAAMVEL
jgi:3-oxoacyl-(acyl-carrier-protein) synthase